jgi:D-alanine-D-alanine ligase
MSDKLNLVLLFGGRSGEHEVSLMSARSILNAINQEKYKIFQVGITKEGRWVHGTKTLEAFETGRVEGLDDAIILSQDEQPYLYKRTDSQIFEVTSIDIVFPALHGTFGEDGTIQGLLEIQNCAYVGAGVLASSLAMDKAMCKAVISNAGIPTLPYGVFPRKEIMNNTDEVVESIEDKLPYPVFVKPANLGSSVGITKARTRAQLKDALIVAARFDRRVLFEKGIDAREIEISIIGNERTWITVPGEIIPGDEFYTYKDKYFSGDPEIAIPAPLSKQLSDQLRTWATTAYQSIDCAGLARVDFLLDKNTGEAWFSEINTMPGFTQISMFTKLLLSSGMEYSEIIDRLIEYGLARKADQDRTIRRFEVENG